MLRGQNSNNKNVNSSPNCITNEDLHRPNKKISVATLVNNQGSSLLNTKASDFNFSEKSMVVSNYELTEKLRDRMQLLKRDKNIMQILEFI